jgi:hypothetical protein
MCSTISVFSITACPIRPRAMQSAWKTATRVRSPISPFRRSTRESTPAKMRSSSRPHGTNVAPFGREVEKQTEPSSPTAFTDLWM